MLGERVIQEGLFAKKTPAGGISGSKHQDSAANEADLFTPVEPQTLADSGLPEQEVHALILKQLYLGGVSAGRRISDQLKLPFAIIQESLRELKQQILISYRGPAAVGDYEIELTSTGSERAKRYLERCTYCGSAPVVFRDYVRAVERQSIHHCRPRMGDLIKALGDLSLSPSLISQIGQALSAGRGMFLYGRPGNGKTTIAERVVRALSPYIWIPRTITIGGEIVRLFDASNHEEAPQPAGEGLLTKGQIDRRWVRILRPAIVVGGELTFSQLELSPNEQTGIIEAPVQLKANCGVLVVDDFGRQRMSTTELLNRWIVPLEKRVDYLTLPSGRQMQVPFDQLIVFSTNLEPRNLVDEAFLRRIPYKIEVQDPTPDDFRDLMRKTTRRLGLENNEEAVDHLLKKHYQEANRKLRFCHVRDLLLQVRNLCEFHELPLELTAGAFDIAVKNYFSSLGDLD